MLLEPYYAFTFNLFFRKRDTLLETYYAFTFNFFCRIDWKRDINVDVSRYWIGICQTVSVLANPAKYVFKANLLFLG